MFRPIATAGSCGMYCATKHAVVGMTESLFRELEGTVLKIVGYASLLGAPVDVALAREVLEGPEKRMSMTKPTNVDDIVDAVASYYGRRPRRSRRAARATKTRHASTTRTPHPTVSANAPTA